MTQRSNRRGVSRRQLLVSTLAMSALGVSGGVARPADLVPGDLMSGGEFHDLCGILTGKSDLNPRISDRILKALTRQDASFPQKAKALRSGFAAEKFDDMSAFDAFARQHPEFRPTAMSIISAWYLGYTGTPAMDATPAKGQPVDDAIFVTYAGALMYRPTKDTTVIPSYARGRTNYWVNPPVQHDAH